MILYEREENEFWPQERLLSWFSRLQPLIFLSRLCSFQYYSPSHSSTFISPEIVYYAPISLESLLSPFFTHFLCCLVLPLLFFSSLSPSTCILCLLDLKVTCPLSFSHLSFITLQELLPHICCLSLYPCCPQKWTECHSDTVVNTHVYLQPRLNCGLAPLCLSHWLAKPSPAVFLQCYNETVHPNTHIHSYPGIHSQRHIEGCTCAHTHRHWLTPLSIAVCLQTKEAAVCTQNNRWSLFLLQSHTWFIKLVLNTVKEGTNIEEGWHEK